MAKGVLFKYAYKGFFINVFDRLIHTICAVVTIPRDWEGIDKLCRDIKKYGERYARTSEFLLNNCICVVERNVGDSKAVIQFYYKQSGSVDRQKIKPVYNKCVDGLIDLINEQSLNKPALKIRAPSRAFR